MKCELYMFYSMLHLCNNVGFGDHKNNIPMLGYMQSLDRIIGLRFVSSNSTYLDS